MDGFEKLVLLMNGLDEGGFAVTFTTLPIKYLRKLL